MRLIVLILASVLAMPTATADVVRIKNLKVLCVLYRGDSAGENHMDDHAVLQAKNGVELARLFYYRNSLARLNCELHWMVFDQAPPDTAGPTMENIEAHLKQQGVRPGEYDGLFVTGVGLSGNFGGFTVLGGAGGCYGGHGVRGKLSWYPQDDPNVAYGTCWNFVHEFEHALDLVICERSGRPDMLHDHPYVDRNKPHFKGFYHGGEHFDWVAVCLREFVDYPSIRGVTNGVLECTDADGDGMPDDDHRLPMDEKRLGSDASKKDTDGDGLDDLHEFIADRYAGSNPTVPDTDGDGIPDGEDPYPLVAIAPTVVYLGEGVKPQLLLDSVFVRNDAGGPVQVYAGWQEFGMQFRFVGPRKFKVHAKLDGSADNGFWEGGDTYLFTFGDGEARFAGLGLDGPVPRSVAYATPSDDGYTLSVRLASRIGQGVSKEINYGGPRDPEDVVDGLTLVDGRSVGFNFIFEFEDGTRAVLTPHHTMYASRLVKPADAPEVVQLRGPAVATGPMVTVNALGAHSTSRVDVATEDGLVVGTRIGPGPVRLTGLADDGQYVLRARTATAESGPHELLVDRTASPPTLEVEGSTLVGKCEPHAEFELWWGLDGLPIAPLDGARADERGRVSFTVGDELTHGWVVTGYADSRFEKPVFVESWDKIDRNWKGGPADERLPADHFSYRLECYGSVSQPGRYTAHLSSDDGSRLWVDDELVIDHWGHHGMTTKSATLELSPRLRRLRADYYELDGWAGLRLSGAAVGYEPTTDLPLRRLPMELDEVGLFGVQTDQYGNRSGFSGPVSASVPGEGG